MDIKKRHYMMTTYDDVDKIVFEEYKQVQFCTHLSLGLYV